MLQPKDSNREDDNEGSTDEWYRGGLAFECTQCGNCCSGPTQGFVWVDDDEIRELAFALSMSDVDEFERRFVRRVGIHRSLVEYSDGDCIFLDPESRTCTVYNARPKQCRTWPFWRDNIASPKAWARTAKQCPGCNHGRVYSIAEIRKQACLKNT